MYYKKLKERKEELQLTTEQLADATHIPTGVINRLLKGEIDSPSPEILRALEQILFSKQPSSDANQTSDCHPASIMRESVPAYQISPPTPIGPYTIEDYLALPDDVRAELIDGNIIYMEAPTVTHQDFLGEIYYAIHAFIKSQKGSCKAFLAPLDVQLDCDDKTMVQPDIIVVCSHDKITEKRIYGAPDLCIEIMSPSTRSHDMVTKLRKYKAAGVREYWMVDIRRRQVICYFFENEISPVIYPFETPVPVHIFDGKLSIRLSEIETPSDHTSPDMVKESFPAYQVSPSTSIGPYTIEDYLALPDDVRAELIDGNIIYMEAPTVTHQDFLFETAVILRSYIKENSGSCKVFVAPLDVQIDCDDKTMVQPDVIVICSRDKITEKRIYGAPDFCIEVMSPSTRNHDMITKLRKYKTAGVREYWMVDTRRKQVICYFFESEISPVIYPFETPVPVHIFDGKLTIDFSELEAGLNR